MADIRRLSAYDRSIKGHWPDNLTIVVRFSPNARPFICVCRPTVRCPRPLGSRPNVDWLLPDSVPITKKKKKKKKSANDRRKQYNLAPSTKNDQPTRKQPNRTQRRPMVHRYSPHMSSFGLADVGRLLVWEMWLRYKNKNFRLRFVVSIRLAEVWQSVIPSGLCISFFHCDKNTYDKTKITPNLSV